MNWVDLIKTLVPIILTAKVPHGDKLAPVVTEAILNAEAIKDAKGKDKLNAVVAEANTVAKAINAAYGSEKINIPALNATIGDAITGVITGANTVKDAKAIVNKTTATK